MLALLHLHGVTQCAVGTGNDGDFMHGGRIFLHRGNQGMADLMIGDDFFFMLRNDCTFALIACQNNFYAFFQIGLGNLCAPHTDSTQRAFIDDVCQLRT